MKFIPIKKEIDKITKEEKYIIPALCIDGPNSKTRKIPHPLGNDGIAFKTLEEAKQAIELAGFLYVLPDGTQAISVDKHRVDLESYDKRIYDALIKETADNNPNIVASAINALSEINHQDSIELYLSKMGEDNESIRQNSIEAILKYGNDALPKVLESLKSENWVKRNSAVICLQRFCETKQVHIDKIIEALLEALKDNNPIVKCSVIKALGDAYKNYRAE